MQMWAFLHSSSVQPEFFHRRPDIWTTAMCIKAAKAYVKDGMGTKHHRPGYIGSHYGPIRYNGGCVRFEEWYQGETVPLPTIPEGFELFRVPTWGYYIRKVKNG